MKPILPLLAVCATAGFSLADAPRPNVVFILADDLGWRDLACYGSTYHETPNLDRLAARGIRFTQAYAASPLCSPTRSSILTGQYPARTGITAPVCHLPQVQLEKRLSTAKNPAIKVLNADSVTRLKSDYVTLAEVLKQAGYATAHFGKWHLGHNLPQQPEDRYEPKDQGFGFDFPHTPNAAGPGGGYLAPWKFIRDPAITGATGEHIENRMSAEAAKYIHAHKSEPFYLNYWAYSVHSPWNARKDFIDRFQTKVDPNNPQRNPLYAAMVKSLDEGVGTILDAIDQAGVADRTIIVFFSDNGGWAFPPKSTDPKGFEEIPATSNLPLRSGKASVYEGGTREPCIVAWPGKTKPGTTTDALLQSVDWFPTLLGMCDVRRPGGILLDGLDQTPALLGAGTPRDRVFCHFPHGSPKQAENIPGFLPATYVRKGDWKLIRFHADNDDGSDRLELYQLKEDPGEAKNLATEKPELVAELNGLISAFLKDTAAVVPVRNPGYDPKEPERQEKAQTADPLQGWKARGCEAVVKDGILVVKVTSKDPFLGFAPGPLAAGAKLHFRLRCAGGEGKLEWLPSPQSPPDPTRKPTVFAVKAGGWADLELAIPAPAEQAGILRLHLPPSETEPAETEPAEIDWIQITSGGKSRKFSF